MTILPHLFQHENEAPCRRQDRSLRVEEGEVLKVFHSDEAPFDDSHSKMKLPTKELRVDARGKMDPLPQPHPPGPPPRGHPPHVRWAHCATIISYFGGEYSKHYHLCFFFF